MIGHTRQIAFAVLVMAWTGGCMLFHSDTTENDSLVSQSHDSALWSRTAASNAAADAITIGVEFLPVREVDLGEDFWNSVDETRLEPELRRAWRVNGLRLGWVRRRESVPQPPTANDPATALLQATGTASSRPRGRDVMRLQLGQRHELPLVPVSNRDEVRMVSKAGRLVGRTLMSPQDSLAIQATMGHRVGMAKLSIQPEIQYGDVQRTFVSGEAALRMASGRQSWSLDDLQLELDVREGDTLVIAPDLIDPQSSSSALFGLGRHWFVHDESIDRHPLTMLVLSVEGIPEMAASR